MPGRAARSLTGAGEKVDLWARPFVHCLTGEGRLRRVGELVIAVSGQQSFVGSPATVAETIDRFVQDEASDGFILVPHLVPGGLDEFADTVVPLLQERGVFRTEYTGPTLRDHLGLSPLARTG
jgi:alkanesulfonate monooxygenase SsuD/methylene tetrahydromethanopterin reductase-like flavin-dependent oxidoreductase (luciferase family)